MADFLELDVKLNDDGVTRELGRIDRAGVTVAKSLERAAASFRALDNAQRASQKASIILTDAWKHQDVVAKQVESSTRRMTSLSSMFGGAASPGAAVPGVTALTRSLGPLASAFGVTALTGAGAALAVGQMTRSAIESASRISDLASKTDLSTDAVQRFGFVAEQTGASVESMASAAFKLGVNLSAGGTTVKRAIDDLGLSAGQIRALKPEEQFDQVARALSKITNTQERNRIGVQLFGRQYEQIAPAIKDYAKLIDNATVAAEENIKAVDDLADTITGLGGTAKAAWIDLLGTILRTGKEALSTAGNVKTAADTMRGGPLNSIFRLGTAAGVSFVATPVKKEAEDFAKVIEDAEASLRAKLTPATEKQIRAYLQLGHSTDELVKQFHLTDTEASIVVGVLDAMKRESEKAAQAFDDHRKAAAKWLREFETELKIATIHQEELAKATAHYTVVQEAANMASANYQPPAVSQPGFTGFLPGVNQFLPGVEHTFSGMLASIRVVNTETTRWSDALEVTSDQFARLAQISQGAMSDVVRGIGASISAVSQLDVALRRVQASTKLTAMDFTSLAASALTLPLTLASVFGEPGNRFTRMQDNRRFLDEQVAQQFGSFEALQRQLQTLGANGAHLWQQLRAPNHVVSETQKFLTLIQQEFDKVAQAAERAAASSRALTDIIRDANFEADQASRTGIDAVLAALEHQRQLALEALQQYAAGDAALYQMAVEAVTRKYTALADRAIRDEADRMTQQTAGAVNELERISGLLDGIKRHTDAEIAGLGAFSSAGSFFDAVIARIQGRQMASELSQLRRAGQIVAPGGSDTPSLVSLGGLSIGQLIVQADQDDPDLARRIGQAIIDDARAKGQRM